MRLRIMSVAFLWIAFALLTSKPVRAQGGLDFRLVQQNLLWDQRFFHRAARESWRLARQIPNNQRLPMNAWTIYRSNRAAQQAMDGYIRRQQVNSARQSAALRPFGRAVRGVGIYFNPHFRVAYSLPLTYGVYHVRPDGSIRPGSVPYGQRGFNIYPRR